nr:DUF6884 domain-containing protein [Sediminibacillus albus]
MGVKERRRWAERVAQDLDGFNIKQVDFYAGKRYREFLIPLLERKGVICKVPLESLNIGKQMKFYNDNFNNGGS